MSIFVQCPQCQLVQEKERQKVKSQNKPIHLILSSRLIDDEQSSEDPDSESESDSSISDTDTDSESSDDGEEKRIKAYVASIFGEKKKQRAVETIQSTGEEDVITLPDETLP